MDQCPHCKAELPITGTLNLTCPQCGESLSDTPVDVATAAVPDSAESAKTLPSQNASAAGSTHPTSDSASMRALARPRRPSPQHEKSVQRRLAATYDLGNLSGRSLETIRRDDPAVDTAKQDIRASKTWTGSGIVPDANISFESTYELDSEIGRGGMGHIWKARQNSLRRDVALKIPYPPESGLDEGSRRQKRHRIERQFVSEVVVTAQLDHPNIVPVYEMGKNADGTPILAMKLLSGNAWDKSIQDKSEDQNLEVLLKTCDAIAFAHAQHVVHLDLKPENVWIGEYGEVFVMDWGVAVRFRADGELPTAMEGSDWDVAAHGLPGLTPAYAAPEMLDSPPRHIGPATDVYLLGALLYEAMTGKAPHAFTGQPMSDAMKAWRNEIVPTDRSSGLIDISLKAMATEPGDRYQSVREFQDALKQYAANKESRMLSENAHEVLENASEYGDFQSAVASYENALSLWPENVAAKKGVRQARFAYAEAAKSNQDFDLGLSILREEPEEEPLVQELVALKSKRDAQTRNLERTRWLLRSLMFAFVAGVVFFSFWISQQNAKNIELTIQAVEARDREIKNKEDAIAARKQAEINEQIARDNEALAEQKKAEAQAAEMLARERKDEADMAAMLADRRARENAELARRNSQIAQRARQSELEAERQKAEALQASYRSKVSYAAETIQQNGFDIARDILKQLREQPLQRKLRHWECGHLERISNDQLVVDFLTANQKQLPPVEAVSMSDDMQIIAAGAEDGTIFIWNQELRTVVSAKHGSAIYAVAVAGNGSQLVTGGVDENGQFDIRLWTPDGKPVGRLDGHAGPVLGLCYSDDDRELLSASADNSARLWDIPTAQEVAVFRGHQDNVRSARFSPDGEWIVTAADDRFVHIWSREEKVLVKRFVGHDGPVYDACFTGDGTFVVSGGEDRRLLRWSDLPQLGEVRQFLDAHVSDVEDAIERGRNTVRATREFEIIGRHAATISSVSCSDNVVFTSSHDNTIRVWDVDTSVRRKTLRGHGRWVRECVGTRDGSRVLTAGYDGRVRLWDWKKHEFPEVLAAPGDGGRPADRRIQALAQSADGRWIATGSLGGELTIWSLSDDEGGVSSQRLRQGHDWLATDGQFFDQGRKLLTTGGDNKAIVWDTQRGTQLFQLGKGWSESGGIGWYGAAAVSPNGKLIATGSDDRSSPLRLWNAETGNPIWSAAEMLAVGQRLGETQTITFAAFSPDNQNILVGDDQGRAFLLAVDDGRVQQRFLGHTKKLNAGAFSPDGSVVFTASSDGSMRSWSTTTGKQLATKENDGPVTSLALSEDGKRLLVGTRTQADSGGVIARMWNIDNLDEPSQELTVADLAKSHPNLRIQEGEANVRSVKFRPDAKHALITTYVRRGGLRRHLVGDWSVESEYEPVLPRRRGGVGSDISSASYAPAAEGEQDPKILVVGGKGARLVTKNTATIVRSFQHARSISSMAFTENGQTLAVGSADGSLTTWRLVGDTWRPVDNSHPDAHAGGVTSLLFHPQSDRLVSTGMDGNIKLWMWNENSQTMELNSNLPAHDGPIRGLSFAPLSNTLFSVGDDGVGKIWSLRDKLTEVEQIEMASANCCSISADGNWVAAGMGNRVSVWDAKTGDLRGQLIGHSAQINSVDFSHDGHRLLTAAADTTVRLWDTRDLPAGNRSAFFDELLSLESHRGAVTAAGFDPTGQYVVSSGFDGEAILWPAEAMAPSLSAVHPIIDFEFKADSDPLPITENMLIVCPTVSSLEDAVLTVELNQVEGEEANRDVVEKLNVALPEGFLLEDRSSTRLVIRRDESVAPSNHRERLEELAAWQRAVRSITYEVAVRDDLPNQNEITAEREISFTLSGPQKLRQDTLGEGNTMLPTTRELIKVRAIRLLD